MKQINRLKTNRPARGVKKTAVAVPPDYFALMAETSISVVEHCTVPEFLNRCRVRTPEDIIRFGDKARRLADSLLLAWVTTTNDSLGVVRCLPVPLMKYLYAHMAPQFGWPPIAAELEDGDQSKRDELKRHERSDTNLAGLAERTDDVETLSSIQAVRDHLAREITRLRAELAGCAVMAGVSPA